MNGIAENELLLVLINISMVISLPLLVTMLILVLYKRFRNLDTRLDEVEGMLRDIVEE